MISRDRRHSFRTEWRNTGTICRNAVFVCAHTMATGRAVIARHTFLKSIKSLQRIKNETLSTCRENIFEYLCKNPLTG